MSSSWEYMGTSNRSNIIVIDLNFREKINYALFKMMSQVAVPRAENICEYTGFFLNDAVLNCNIYI